MTQQSKVLAFKPDSLSLDPWNSHGRRRKMTPINFLDLQGAYRVMCVPTQPHTTNSIIFF